MHHIVEAPKPNPTSGHPISRRALLEGSASTGFVAAAAGGGSVLRPGEANAADPGAGGSGARQMAAFRSGSSTGVSQRTGAVAPV
jgi:hypothetical protein